MPEITLLDLELLTLVDHNEDWEGPHPDIFVGRCSRYVIFDHVEGS
jgi:hypothetical protein